MAQILQVAEDGSVVINKVTLNYTSGSVIHSGSLEVTGNVQLDTNLVVLGTVIADTFNVKNLVTENGSLASVGQWIYSTEAELNGKGFQWAWGAGKAQLAYRTGGRIWADCSFDVSSGNGYSIDNIPVLTSASLGPTITSSNLTKVGTLESLTVSGDVKFADFVHIDSTSNRIGIGTEEPNAAISIIDNNVELTFGSPQIGLGSIGTHSYHDFAVVTDNIPRITVKNSGEVQIGNAQSMNGSLRVYGTIYADSVETATGSGQPKSVQFAATENTSVYGLGLQWSGVGPTRQLVMTANPDRLWTTENFDLAENRSYHINGQLVLGEGTLGPSIVESSLTRVGTLVNLAVSGNSLLNSVTAQSLALGSTTYNSAGISVDGQSVMLSNNTQIVIGDVNIQNKPVKVFGPLSVNVNNPDPTLQFSVNGDVNIGGKRFTTGVTHPGAGTWTKGDICWNTNPNPNGYVGWICVASGTPGTWNSFGQISSQ